jgi:hypothetical protein
MNLNDMTVLQLREIAAELYVNGRSKMKKADLITAIEAAEQALRDNEAAKNEYLNASDAERKAARAEMEERNRPQTGTEEIDLSGMATMLGRDIFGTPSSDHNPDTEGRPAAIDVTPNPTFVKPVRNVNVEIERDTRGGRMMYVFEEDGDMQSIRLVKRGRRWETVIDRNYSRFVVKAGSLRKLVKQWAKKSGAWAKQIDITV